MFLHESADPIGAAGMIGFLEFPMDTPVAVATMMLLEEALNHRCQLLITGAAMRRTCGQVMAATRQPQYSTDASCAGACVLLDAQDHLSSLL